MRKPLIAAFALTLSAAGSAEAQERVPLSNPDGCSLSGPCAPTGYAVGGPGADEVTLHWTPAATGPTATNWTVYFYFRRQRTWHPAKTGLTGPSYTRSFTSPIVEEGGTVDLAVSAAGSDNWAYALHVTPGAEPPRPSGGGSPPPPEPEPEPDPDPDPAPPPESEPACAPRVAPYWHGTGGFAVRPTDGESAVLRIECAGQSHMSRERAGEDGLIVRTVSQPLCTAEDGRPTEGEMTFEGIDGDGWYWVSGDRNLAVAPLVCEESLNPGLRPPVPGGVTARPSGDRRLVLSVQGTWHGTLMVHDESGFMGIVPHLKDLEGDGEHVAPYWKGGGGIVGRPLDGSRATVRLACGEADAENQVLDAGEDGLIVALLPGCFDEEGAAVRGRLEADGLEDGAWYWLNTGMGSAAAPLLRRGADVDLTVPVLPGGVDVDVGPLGTLFSRGPLLGVVPRVERVEN